MVELAVKVQKFNLLSTPRTNFWIYQCLLKLPFNYRLNWYKCNLAIWARWRTNFRWFSHLSCISYSVVLFSSSKLFSILYSLSLHSLLSVYFALSVRCGFLSESSCVSDRRRSRRNLHVSYQSTFLMLRRNSGCRKWHTYWRFLLGHRLCRLVQSNIQLERIVYFIDFQRRMHINTNEVKEKKWKNTKDLPDFVDNFLIFPRFPYHIKIPDFM